MGYVFDASEVNKAIHLVGVKLSSREVGWLDERCERAHGDVGFLMDRRRGSYRLTRSSLLRLLLQAAMNPDGDAAISLRGFLSEKRADDQEEKKPEALLEYDARVEELRELGAGVCRPPTEDEAADLAGDFPEHVVRAQKAAGTSPRAPGSTRAPKKVPAPKKRAKAEKGRSKGSRVTRPSGPLW